MGNRLGVALIGLAGLTLCACGGTKKTGGDTTPLQSATAPDAVSVPRVDASLCDTSSKQVRVYDLNRDDKPDVWKMFMMVEEGGTEIEVLTCKQVDLDHDGRKDYVITYNERGAKLSEEFDFDYDGRFDARKFFDPKSGKLFLVERDSDHNKAADIWEKYDKAGLLESVRRDRNSDGKPDVWEQYNEGLLVSILYDDDYDTKVDRQDEVTKPQRAGSDEGDGGGADAPAPDSETDSGGSGDQ